MSFKGRIIGLVLIILNGVSGILYTFYYSESIEMKSIILMVIQLPLGWYLGKQFDKVHFLNNKLQQMAYHDYLTGLPNRSMLANYFETALYNNKLMGIMYIDLDRFKFINDTMGHDIGDQLLIQVSKRISENVRERDVVVRQGGDEFIVLLEDVSESEVKEIAELIIHHFNTPFSLQGRNYLTSPSIGISMYPIDGQDLNTLTKHADTAMYMSKKRGKNNYHFYIQQDEDILNRALKLERGLKAALENNEFSINYQPKVNLENENIFAVEALLRWNHPEMGFISPLEFIPIAEATGMILPIGNWVLKEACKQNKLWQESGSWIKMNVNVSNLQFEDQFFVEKVKRALTESQLAPEYLGLEVTESVIANISHSSAIIQELKTLGIKISIDDFGTGYSSLSVLNNLPIDVIKIDKSFVDEMLLNPNTALVVKTIIEMGKNLKFDLIAEGIENKQQAQFLIENGCIYGQGYFYSRPLPAVDVEKLLPKNYNMYLEDLVVVTT
ncbi:putative bifunctional diguanylate cyclase/phosphodiesterase [Mesobacillus harenae]|uniref:putative bifunctional diguanylate cyclase/phosphodiesterase n=1 Tax=Mesobacillus harenae TaxID=2213203 RepID=UPI0015809BC0|nr:EAL domain-containing protein [Mesobacillus harenae]